MQEIIKRKDFINGLEVHEFARQFESKFKVKYCLPCANGTDALQLAYMALLNRGDEVIIPAFTYISPVEAATLLGLKVVFSDVDYHTYNIDPNKIKITKRTKAIVAVHLFGQHCDMTSLKYLAKKHNLILIEDNAQSLGGTSDGKYFNGDIGCTSFFPSKNLSCYGDGGAVYTNSKETYLKIKAIANHGQTKRKYFHDYVGINSRLDTIQASVLIKNLKTFDSKIDQQIERAIDLGQKYGMPEMQNPHTFNNFTIKVKNRNIMPPHRVYYPIPAYKQKAYKQNIKLEVTERLCKEVITL